MPKHRTLLADTTTAASRTGGLRPSIAARQARILWEMECFLSVAWHKDGEDGEADYDLDREDFSVLAPYLAMDMFEKPRKIQIFEAAQKKPILHTTLTTEADLYRFCLNHAMIPMHAKLVAAQTK